MASKAIIQSHHSKKDDDSLTICLAPTPFSSVQMAPSTRQPPFIKPQSLLRPRPSARENIARVSEKTYESDEMDGLSIVEFDAQFENPSFSPLPPTALFVNDTSSLLGRCLIQTGQTHTALAEIYRKLKHSQEITTAHTARKRELLAGRDSVRFSLLIKEILWVMVLERRQEIWRRKTLSLTELYQLLGILQRSADCEALLRQTTQFLELDSGLVQTNLLADLLVARIVGTMHTKVLLRREQHIQLEGEQPESQKPNATIYNELDAMRKSIDQENLTARNLRAEAAALYATLGKYHRVLDQHSEGTGVLVFVTERFRLTRRPVPGNPGGISIAQAVSVVAAALHASWNQCYPESRLLESPDRLKLPVERLARGEFQHALRDSMATNWTAIQQDRPKYRWNVLEFDD